MIASARRAGTFIDRHALAVMFSLSVIGWGLFALLCRPAPDFFPDEYLYVSFARDLAHLHLPDVRGEIVAFPSLLWPALTAPFWLLFGADGAYRASQLFNTITVSLTVFPVYWVAIEVGLRRRVALLAAAFAVLLPSLLRSSNMVTSPLAYPLVIVTIYLYMRILNGEQTRRNRILLLVATTATIVARFQFLALPAVFLLTALLHAIRGRSIEPLRRQAWLLIPSAIITISALIFRAAMFGFYYRAASSWDFRIGTLARAAATNANVSIYSLGVIAVPAVLVGLYCGLFRARNDREFSFSALVLSFALALFAEATSFTASAHGQSHERYFAYAIPLLAISACTIGDRGRFGRLAQIVIALPLLIVPPQWPIIDDATTRGLDNSATLYAFNWLWGKFQAAPTVVPIIAVALILLSIVAAYLPRYHGEIILATASAAVLVITIGAAVFEADVSKATNRVYYEQKSHSWIDTLSKRYHLGNQIALVETGKAGAPGEFNQLFWNASVDRMFYLPGSDGIDEFEDNPITIAPDGELRSGQAGFHRPFVLSASSDWIRFDNAKELGHDRYWQLYRPSGASAVQLRLYVHGRDYNGWLAGNGTIDLWPREAGGHLEGRLKLTLSTDRETGGVTMIFGSRRFHVVPGRPVAVVIPVCAGTHWMISFHSTGPALLGSADSIQPSAALGPLAASARASAPTFRPGTVAGCTRN